MSTIPKPQNRALTALIEAATKTHQERFLVGDEAPDTMNIEEARTSTARPDFDAEHATNLMMSQGGGHAGEHNFYHNHFMYGVNAAKKRKAKGTLEDAKLDKAGENLSKLGKWRVETFSHKSDHQYMPQNAAEHRAVGKLIADHIRSHIGEPTHHIDV